MADIPTTEPATIVAGDTLKWKRSLDDYKASDGWSLSYELVNSAGKYSISSSADGDDHSVEVAAGTTANYAPGVYQWAAFVTKSGERYRVDYGTVEVVADFQTVDSLDTRSHAKKTLDAIEAVLENRATKDQESYTINGRSLSRTPLDQLLAFRKQYRKDVAREAAAERRRNGKSARKTVKAKFV